MTLPSLQFTRSLRLRDAWLTRVIHCWGRSADTLSYVHQRMRLHRHPAPGACSMTPPHAVLANLWSETGLDAEALQHIALTGDDPVLPSSFRVGTAAQVSIGAAAL